MGILSLALALFLVGVVIASSIRGDKLKKDIDNLDWSKEEERDESDQAD